MIWIILLILSPMLSGLSYGQSLTGDINGDGRVDEADLDRGTEIVLGRLPTASENELAAADLDRDGRVTVKDLVLIANTIGGQNRPPVADGSASPDSGLVGVDIQLDGGMSLDLDGDSLRIRWQQVHMDRYDEVYATEHQAVLNDTTDLFPIFQAPGSGKYRFELTVSDASGLTNVDTVDVWVRPEQVRNLDVTGTIMADIFGEYGEPAFDILPDDADSVTAVLNQAMEASVRVGAKWVGVVPSAWYAQISPLPVIATGPNDLGLTEESDYAAIVQAAKARGLMVIHEEQVSVGILPLRPGEADSLVTSTIKVPRYVCPVALTIKHVCPKQLQK